MVHYRAIIHSIVYINMLLFYHYFNSRYTFQFFAYAISPHTVQCYFINTEIAGIKNTKANCDKFNRYMTHYKLEHKTYKYHILYIYSGERKKE